MDKIHLSQQVSRYSKYRTTNMRAGLVVRVQTTPRFSLSAVSMLEGSVLLRNVGSKYSHPMAYLAIRAVGRSIV